MFSRFVPEPTGTLAVLKDRSRRAAAIRIRWRDSRNSSWTMPKVWRCSWPRPRHSPGLPQAPRRRPGQFVVRPDLPAELRVGVFGEGRVSGLGAVLRRHQPGAP